MSPILRKIGTTVKPIHIYILVLFLLGLFAGVIISGHKQHLPNNAYLVQYDSILQQSQIREKFLQAGQRKIDSLERASLTSRRTIDSLQFKLNANHKWYLKEISRYKNYNTKELEDEAESIYRDYVIIPGPASAK